MTVGVYYTFVKPAGGRDISGLRVAVEDWLKAWFRYGSPKQFHFLVDEATEWNRICEIAESAGLDGARLVRLDRQAVRESFAQMATVFRLNPDPEQLLWQRSMLSGKRFNFCGLAHAISGKEAGKVLEQYCLGPSESTDMIVCPSRALKASIQSFWDLYSDYLQQRFGANFKCAVQLPVIPLGIDTERFRSISTPAKRKEQRLKLNLTDEDVVVLWVGRLNFATKTHPLAMLQAVERAAELTGIKVHFVMVGSFMPAKSAIYFHKLADDFCSQTKVTFITGDDSRFPDGLWASGDIFLSLVDNMQESFGLTPIEAMAAGLPRVVSDWDGYRDSITDNEDGFLIRTTQPPPGSGRELSENLLSGRDTYGSFLAKCALTVSIDVEMAAKAIALLIQDKSRRKAIAEKARTRALENYDWRQIIPAYEALWEEMSQRQRIEKMNPKPQTWRSASPQAPDPFTMHASHPTSPLKESDRLTLTASTNQINKLWRHEINVLAADIMLPPEELMQLIRYVSAHDVVSIESIFEKFPVGDQPRQWRTLAWLIKLGIFHVL